MNNITEMPNTTAAATFTKQILADDRLKSSILIAGPREEIPLPESAPGTESYLVVLEGEATVRSGSINTMLRTEESMRLTNKQPCSVSNQSAGWVRLLRLDVVDKRVSEPLIVTLPD
jgi:hypothetical protein